MKKAELVFVPVAFRGHLVSTVEFAKRLIQRDDRFSVTILPINSPFGPDAHGYNKSHLAFEPGLRLIDLPPQDPPPPYLKKSIAQFLSVYIESYIPHVKDAIINLKSTRPLAGVVLDFVCISMIDVANELGLPSYLFLTSGAALVSLMLYLPTRHTQISAAFEDADPELVIPGFINPVPVSVLPEALRDKHGGYASFIKVAQRFREAKGIIINTFTELEPFLVGSFSDGQAPPVYTVGPVLDLEGQAHSSADRADHDKVMAWLDTQPESSVVFLCFGSLGTFDVPQVREIALGLERSTHRFLWSLRRPPPDGEFGSPSEGTNLDEMLPEGFMERIGGKGMICGWAPQVKVLAHEAIAGFVSHCGWNSILESVWNSVPIVTWPLYAEQKLNEFEMVKELGLAVEMRLDSRYDGDVVMAEEIDGAVRRVMEADSTVRKMVKEMGEKSRRAMMEGGSSYNSFERLIHAMINTQ
ncbi:UDP-glycosyltransferase 71K1-like [Vitis riparia]|uniref:UDP-glycosyltransferase 71K1-like n=1 Tax=Vitis riparia TaxID=96939 RepID=UPI00155B1D5C|nr:UDP-glycosyltransferase 71K1-like [Vitis riparia]